MAIVKIQHRRGDYADYDPTKVLPGEIAVTQANDPNSTDGEGIYIGTAAGHVKQLATMQDMESAVETAVNGAISEVTDKVDEYLEEIETKGEEVLDSIPADYTQLSNDVDDLKDDLSEVIEVDEEEINRSEFINMSGYYIGVNDPHTIGQSSGTGMMYIPCQANTKYTITKTLSARFIIAYTTAEPQNGSAPNGYEEHNNDTTVVYITGNDAAYLCVYYKHSSDTLTENEIYNSITISYLKEITALDKIARSEIEAIIPGLSDDAKAALLACFAHVAWIDEYGQDYYDALEEALDVAPPVKPIITLADWIYPNSTPVNKGFTQYGNAPSDDGSGLLYNTSGGYTYSIPVDETTEKIIVETTITPTNSYTPPSSSYHEGVRFNFTRGNVSINSLGIVYVENTTPSEYIVLGSASINTTYKIKAEIDMANETVDIYINDNLARQNAPIDLSQVTASAYIRIASTTGSAKYRLNSFSCKKQ